MMRNLDAMAYVDAAAFARERHGIFASTWQLLGPAATVAEARNYIAAEIAGLKIFVIRGRDGMVRGFRNVCRHRGARLLEEGSGKCATIRCPYHNWVFNDEGRLINAPWFGDDPGFNLDDWPLTAVEVREWRGLLFAAISPRQSLEEQLGDLAAELGDEPIESYKPVRSERMEFHANWKIYTDNFVEGYHIPGIHPAFFAAINFEEFSTTAREDWCA